MLRDLIEAGLNEGAGGYARFAAMEIVRDHKSLSAGYVPQRRGTLARWRQFVARSASLAIAIDGLLR
jgi:hypothetical protein